MQGGCVINCEFDIKLKHKNVLSEKVEYDSTYLYDWYSINLHAALEVSSMLQT